jgi:hypothetical protein
MIFNKEDLAPLTTNLVSSGQFTPEQVTAVEEGMIELFGDQHFLHKLVHALMSVQHNH